MKTVAIILAGGIGKRMNVNTSKQLLKINNKHIIDITLEKFQNNDSVDEIIVVSNIDDLEYLKKDVCIKYNKVKKVICGGKERQDSVYNALCELESDAKYVLIHDGVRPFVDDLIITNIINETALYKATALGVPCKNTVKKIDKDGFVKETLKRDELFEIQTPQGFYVDLLKDAYKHLKENNLIVTDDASVVECFGHKVKIVEGSYNNIKITTKEDLKIALAIYEEGGDDVRRSDI